MIAANTCPRFAQLQELMAGKLPEKTSDTLCEHLSTCSACQTATQQFGTTDRFSNLVRQSGRQPVAAIPLGMERVIATLKDRAMIESRSFVNSEITSSEFKVNGDRAKSPSTTMDDLLTDLLANIRPAEAFDELGRLGDFRLLRLLGYGGMGAVFLAEDLRLQRQVAIKLVRADLARRHEGKERFLREARAVAKIRDENVVTIYQVGEENGVPFLAQELLEGETLEDRLSRQNRFRIAEALHIAHQIALGLKAAHEQGVVHRDIKPGNVFLAKNSRATDATESVKLLDFGLARGSVEEIPLTQSGLIVGTLEFMSPEQASGESVDHRTDLFSLGCILYLMLTGERPFRGEKLMRVLDSLANDTPVSVIAKRPEVPAELSQLTDQLLSKTVEDRPSSASEVATRITRILSSTTTPQIRPKLAQRAEKPPRRPFKAILIALAGAAMIMMFGALIITITNRNGMKTKILVPEGSTVTIDAAKEVPTATLQEIESTRPDSKTVATSRQKPTDPAVSTLTDQSSPYALIREGLVVSEYSYLPIYLTEFRDGDVIEIRGNGPFRLPQIHLLDRGLHLRAAAGYQPVFVPADSVLPDQQWIVVQRGQLRLEGCEFRRMRYDDYHMIVATGDSCEIENCTLIRGPSNAHAIADCSCPKVHISNSLLISGNGHLSLTFASTVREITFENNLYLSESYNSFAIASGDGPRSIRIEHNTFWGNNTLISGEFLKPSNRAVTAQLQAVVQRNLFTNPGPIQMLDLSAKMAIDDYRARISWNGEGNLATRFADQSFMEELAGVGQSGLTPVPSLSSQVGQVWNSNLSLAERLSVIRNSLAADVLADGTSLGINWDRVGPGPGYLHTLDPIERSQQHAAITLDGGPFTLVHSTEPVRGFTTLSDAVRVAEDGDTIELRTNDSVIASLDPSIAGRRLTIRAAEGYQPKTLDMSQLRLGSGHDWEFINLTFRGSLGSHSDGQIRRVTNCAFETAGEPVPDDRRLWLSALQTKGPDLEIVNCVLPGVTLIDVGTGRKVVIRNSILESCQLGSQWTVEGDQYLAFEDCVILNGTQMRSLISVGHPAGRGLFSAKRCLFDGFAIYHGPPGKFAWSGDQKQFRLWNHRWYWDGSLNHTAENLHSWQKLWNCDAHSNTANSIYFDPDQWRILQPVASKTSSPGIDFARFHRPPALR